MRALLTTVLLSIITISVALAQTGEEAENKDVRKRYLYQWTDSRGVVHITDDLGEVPDRFRSKAHKIETRQDEEPGSGPQVQEEIEPFPDSGAEEAEADAKAEWQQRLKDWKKRLMNAETRYRDLDQERNELFSAWGSAALAPIANKLKAEQIEQQMKDVQREIDNARNMIENVIPEEARKAGVPPGWLRE